MKLFSIAVFIGFWAINVSFAQVYNSVGIATSIDAAGTAPDASAMLDVKGSAKGVLVPRMTTPQRLNIISPAQGLLVFDLTTNGFWYFNAASWTPIGSGPAGMDGVGITTTVDNNNGTFTIHYSNGTSFTTIDLTGPQGLIGATGLQGAQGATGLTGMQGLQGPQGLPGATGLTGPQGIMGISGNAGPNINDIDLDTYVEVEKNADEDIIRFSIGGYEHYHFLHNANGVSRLNIPGNGFNILFGGNAGTLLDSTALCNTVFGSEAATLNVSGDHNTMLGFRAGGFLTSSFNTLIGSTAGAKITTGISNSILGYGAGSHMSVGHSNVFLGSSSAAAILNGNRNTYVGNITGLNNEGGDDNVFIGNSVGSTDTLISDRLIIDNSNSIFPLLFGEFDNDRLGVNWDRKIALPNTLSVDGDASKSVAGDWLANSDKRLKKNIKYLDSRIMLKNLLAMKAVSYEWNDTSTGFTRPEGAQYGFIAQDIEKVWPENVKIDPQGYLQTAYGTYDFLYVEAIKALHEENQELKLELQENKKAIEGLNLKLERLLQSFDIKNSN